LVLGRSTGRNGIRSGGRTPARWLPARPLDRV